MEKFMDLHTHTIYSDGDKTPKELIKMAKDINLTHISITDHDIISGLKTLDEDDLKEINLISGVELTAKTLKGRMHILGYNIDIYDKKLNEKLNNRNDLYNFILYVNGLKELFKISFPKEEVDKITNKIGTIGRPDLAKLLMKYGYVDSIQEAFDKYLNSVMDICRTNKRGYTKEECIEIILESGGIPILAHPISLKKTRNELIEEIKYLKNIGLMGIETIHSLHTPEYKKMLEQIALELKLFTTGGSDYHGNIKPNVELGTGTNNNVIVNESTMIDYLTNLNKQKIKCIKKKNINK